MNIQDRIYYDQGWNDRLDDKPLLVFQCSSDAQLQVIDEVIRLLESSAVMPTPLGGINYPPERYFGLLHDFKRVRAELAKQESGLPAGSDVVRTNAAKYLRAFLTYLDPEDNESSYNSIEDTAHALERAPAEQPSCGQDARDATRYRWLRSQGFGFSHDENGTGVATARWGDWPFDTDEGFAAVSDSIIDAAIAAQQRQGGAK